MTTKQENDTNYLTESSILQEISSRNPWCFWKVSQLPACLDQTSASAMLRRQNEMLNWHHLRRCQNLQRTYDLRNGCSKHICKPNRGSEPLNSPKLFKKSRLKKYNNVQQNHTSYFKTSRQKRYNKSFFHKKHASFFHQTSNLQTHPSETPNFSQETCWSAKTTLKSRTKTS